MAGEVICSCNIPGTSLSANMKSCVGEESLQYEKRKQEAERHRRNKYINKKERKNERRTERKEKKHKKKKIGMEKKE